MHRRRFLAVTVAATVGLAGCSGSDETNDDGTNSDDGGDEPDYDATGEVVDDDPFEAVSLGAVANDDNTLTISGELRYTGDGSVVVSSFFFNYYDTEGRGMISSSSALDGEKTVASDETFTFEITTDEFGKADVANVGSFETIVSSRAA